MIPSYTDNRVNGSLLNKLMSSKHPLSALLMDLNEQLRHSGVQMYGGHRERRTVCASSWSSPRRSGGWFILGEALELGAEAEDEKKKYSAEVGCKRQVKGMIQTC